MRSFAILLMVFSIPAGMIVGTGATHAEEPAIAPGDHHASMRIQPMSEDRFWALIGTTTAFESDPERQLTALHAALEKLSIEEIEAYETTFGELMRRSYSWDLWGA